MVKTDRSFLSHPLSVSMIDWSTLMSTIAVKTYCKFLNERNLRHRMTLYLQARRNRVHIKLEYNLDNNIPSNLNHNWTRTWKHAAQRARPWARWPWTSRISGSSSWLRSSKQALFRWNRQGFRQHPTCYLSWRTVRQSVAKILNKHWIFTIFRQKKLCGGDTQRICIW